LIVRLRPFSFGRTADLTREPSDEKASVHSPVRDKMMRQTECESFNRPGRENDLSR
jgi:hypothetical protein